MYNFLIYYRNLKLDRESVKSKRTNIILLINVLLVLAITYGLRAFSISDRPFHNDEGVNYFFMKSVLTNGIFNYSHENYHGPSYFYLLALTNYIFGTSDFTIRLASIIPSLVLVPFLLFSFNYVSISARTVAGLFLAISTTFVYYSRYSIHESFLVVNGVLGIHFLFKWLLLKRHRDLIYLFFTIGLTIATKETFIIHIFSLGIASFCVFSLPVVFKSLLNSKKTISWGIVFLCLPVFVLYSGFFQSLEGLREFFMGVPQWVGRGYSDGGHHKPYDYYVKLLDTTEPVALLGFVPAAFFIFYYLLDLLSKLRKTDSKNYSTPSLFTVEEKASYMFSLYAMVSLSVYSYVPYKTPWLIINIAVPSLIGLAFFICAKIKNRIWMYVVAFFLSLNLTLMSLRYNYLPETLGPINQIVDSKGVVGEFNPLAYVHTHSGMVESAERIVEYSRTHKNTRVLIGVSAYWPLPYYLREIDSQLMYAQGSDPQKYFDSYSIIIVDKKWNVEKEGWDKEYVRLSDNQESYVYTVRD